MSQTLTIHNSDHLDANVAGANILISRIDGVGPGVLLILMQIWLELIFSYIEDGVGPGVLLKHPSSAKGRALVLSHHPDVGILLSLAQFLLQMYQNG